jgi:hypothetical protein
MNLNEQLRRIKTIMGINESALEFNEVSDDVYNRINDKYADARIVMSKHDMIKFKPISIDEQWANPKPEGLWYGIGSSWIDWVRWEIPERESDNVFKIDVDEGKMLLIRDNDELDSFVEKYGVEEFRSMMIDWAKVASEYGGIEISPYLYEEKREYMWYDGWDVASGCIWGDGVIVNIEKIND